MKKALLTGITGQDGSYLTEFLLEKGYEIHGMIRRSSSPNTGRLDQINLDNYPNKLILHHGDLTDSTVVADLISKIRPNEIYNLAAQSHVKTSFEMPEYTGNVVGLGVARILESLRQSGIKTKFYQASSSEMFGSSPPLQSENSPFQPQNPYGVAKLYAYWLTKNYRASYDLFACNGILFNHESPRRGETFVTRKITKALARIKLGLQDKLNLGNLDAKRDWGYAKEYVEAMWLMLQQERPDDYVIATGETHSVREFLDEAFGSLDLDWHQYVEVDPAYYRPSEVNVLCGDASYAKKKLDWEPKVKFKELVKLMVDTDLKTEKHILEGMGSHNDVENISEQPQKW